MWWPGRATRLPTTGRSVGVSTKRNRRVCLPYRVGLLQGRYPPAGEPLPALSTPTPEPTPETLELPADLIDLEGWLVATLRVVDQDRIFGAVARAEREAAQRFAPGEVVTALRRVLSVELARR
jgi:hypothetical protein